MFVTVNNRRRYKDSLNLTSPYLLGENLINEILKIAK